MVSVCIYGSVARGSNDKLSDRDVLIVGRNPAVCENSAQEWRASGWNVAYFSRDRFEKMAKFGSLFIQHLKSEGRVIADDGYLRALLASFQPVGPYSSQLEDALEPVDWIRDFQEGYWSRLCLADLLFVALRNAAVTSHAIRQRYLFDFKILMQFLSKECGLTRGEAAALQNLRQLKGAYRERNPSVDVVSCWPLTVSAAIKARDHLKLLCPKFVQVGTKPLPIRRNAYFALRRFELMLLQKHDPRELDELMPTDEHYEVWRLIRDPTNYDKLEHFGREIAVRANAC